MKAFLIIAGLMAMPAAALASDCEILLTDITGHDENLISFMDADVFLESVYDDQDGYRKTIAGQAVSAVMCMRPSPVPTLRDLPIVDTGLPFFISENFDDPNAFLIRIMWDGNKYQAKYNGDTLTDSDKSALEDVLEIFNLQPRDVK